MNDHTTTSPRVAVERRNDFACLVSQLPADESAIEVAGGSGVELVDAVDEECLEFLACAVVAKLDMRVIHGTVVDRTVPLHVLDPSASARASSRSWRITCSERS